MAYRHLSLAQLLQAAFMKHLRNHADILVKADLSILIHSDSGACLPSMLKGVKGQIGLFRHIQVILVVNAKQPTFFMRLSQHSFPS